MKKIIALAVALLIPSLLSADTKNGFSSVRKVAANSNNSTLVSARNGRLISVTVCAGTAAVGYLKLYDKSTAPTCGTDTPILVVNTTATIGSCQHLLLGAGLAFRNGLGYCMVTGVADSDNTSVALNQMVATIGYE